MFRKLRSRLSYANVVSSLCLFLVLGGGLAVAGAPNSIVSGDIVNGEVKNPDLGANSVGGGKVINNALTGSDINENTLGTVPHATDAETLNDKTPGFYEPSSRHEYGSANSKATSQLILFEWPEADVQIRTDGDTDADNDIRVRNTRPAGGGDLAVVPEDGDTTVVTEQQSRQYDGGADRDLELTVVDPGSNRTLAVQCVFPAISITPANCFGLRSRPN